MGSHIKVLLVSTVLCWAAVVNSDPIPSAISPVNISSPLKNLFTLKGFEFEDGESLLNTKSIVQCNEFDSLLPLHLGPSQSVSVIDFDYDPYTGYLCAAFKRMKTEEVVPTVACFDTVQYKPNGPVKFSAFPSLEDNLRPDQLVALPLARNRSPVEDEESSLFDETPTKLHLQRLLGRSSKTAISDGIVSTETTILGGLEGNEDSPPIQEDIPIGVSLTDNSSTTESPKTPPDQRKPYNFISVNKIHFDDCGRMWLFDSGMTTEDRIYRPPMLYSFQILTTEDRKLLNKLFLRYELTTPMSANGVSDFAIDIHGDKCDDFHVYMSNYLDNSIIVYHHRRRVDYAIFDEALTGVKSEANHLFQGETYQFRGGVFSMSLAELNEHGYRNMFFTLASGAGEYVVSTKTLRAKTSHRYFRSVGYRGCNANALNHVYDTLTKVVFYMDPQTKSVRCWNTNKRLVPENIGIVFTDEKLSTGWSVKIDQANNLWFMANDFNFFTGQKVAQSGQEVMNIYRGKIRQVIQGTVCDYVLSREAEKPKDGEDTFDQYIDAVLELVTDLNGSVDSEDVNNKPSPGDTMNISGGEKDTS